MDSNETMLDMYLFESVTLLEQLDEILIQAEKAQHFSGEDINEIFRIMHTIKGSSAMMEFEPVMIVSHRIEDVFFFVREQGVNEQWMPELFNLMFKSGDYLRAQIQRIEAGQELERDIGAFVEGIENFLAEIKGEPAATVTEAKGSVNKEEPQAGWGILVFFDLDCGMENLRGMMLRREIEEVCDEFTHLPAELEGNSEASQQIIASGFQLFFPTEKAAKQAEEVIMQGANVMEYQLLTPAELLQRKRELELKLATNASANEQSLEATAEEQAEAHNQKASKQSLISVNLQKLDKLMDIVGEIVITESMVTACPELDGLKLDAFKKAARELRKLTIEMQDSVMSIRMLPVAGIFQKMNRIVRDMEKKLGKRVHMTIIGEETEVDKTIVDSIGDPIMHLVRNAIDHGIEDSEEQRIAAGKEPIGQLWLAAKHTGSEVIIAIQDDGKGMSAENILKKAKARGLLTKPENEYSRKEIFSLILLPGFSTNEAVTEFSGRGVGMDVVKQNIEKVGGSIYLDSEEGIGTNVTLKIPLTLAIVGGMKVAVGASVFTIPINNIRQSFIAKENEVIRDTQGREIVQRMDKFYPVLKLYQHFELPTEITELTEGIMVLVEAEEKAYCLFVDKLLGEQQVVVKPVPTYLTKFSVKEAGIAGCAILSNGSISIILDAVSLAERV